MSGEGIWCAVTGGRGFAARHLVEMLLRCDAYSVRIADLPPEIELEPHEENGILGESLRSGRAQYISADLRNKDQLLKAFEGVEVVFHMAAPNSSINNFQLHYSVNVQGTKNVISSCIDLKVKRLIYTSSASVVFDGVHGIFNGKETMPYPAEHIDSYSSTKTEAEALIIKSNGINGLLTCSLRPSGIFGPGDRLFAPSLISAAKAGKSKFIIGDGNNIYDFTYVENVAHAHLCAERALASGGEVAKKAAGQAYFITNMEPIKFWEFVAQILEGLGYERPRIKVPAIAVMPIAYVIEWTYMLFGRFGMKVPQLIPSRIRLLSGNRSFDSSKAKERLGYEPVVPLQEGIKRTVEAFSYLRAKNQPKREGPSKASILLGQGRVADTLLWKDKRQSLITILVLVAIYYNFIASGSTMISALSKLLLMTTIFLFIHGSLPDKILGYTIEKIPASKYHLSEEKSRQLVMLVASLWNNAVNGLRSLCKGKDFTLFLKVVSSLLLLSFAGSISLWSLFTIGLPVAFVAFFVYEKYEQEIDGMVMGALSAGCKLKSDVSRKFSTIKKND